MAEEQVGPPVPDPPAEAVEPPPVSEDFARSTARFQLSSAASSLAVANTALKSAQATSAQWSDGFWAVSGYNKAAVTGAIERLVAAVDEFQATHAADIAVLNNQAEA